VPRDRDGTFAPTIVGRRQRRLDGVDEIVLSLTARGLTTGEIAAHFASGLRRESQPRHLWGARIRSPALTSRFQAARSYSLIKPPRIGRHLIPFMTEVCHGLSWSWRAKFGGAVRASTVVVPDVFREHHMQVPLTEDQ
jgi:hypothetical protein